MRMCAQRDGMRSVNFPQARQVMKWMISLCLVLSVVPALAQAPGGTFKATLDGKTVTCQIWPMQSDFLRAGNGRTVSTQANRCEGMASQIP